MKNLIIHGDPGNLRRGAVIEYDGEEYVCFSVKRNAEWHGPDRPQLWCTVGEEDEWEAYERRQYVQMHLDTLAADAEAVTVVEAA